MNEWPTKGPDKMQEFFEGTDLRVCFDDEEHPWDISRLEHLRYEVHDAVALTLVGNDESGERHLLFRLINEENAGTTVLSLSNGYELTIVIEHQPATKDQPRKFFVVCDSKKPDGSRRMLPTNH
jgi:hypothetical protein